jgi:hypothetical protein
MRWRFMTARSELRRQQESREPSISIPVERQHDAYQLGVPSLDGDIERMPDAMLAHGFALREQPIRAPSTLREGTRYAPARSETPSGASRPVSNSQRILARLANSLSSVSERRE